MNLETSLASMIARDADGLGLAHRPAFQVGAVEVVPARRELRAQDRASTIQPLAMRVLVALADAYPGTCSREDLIRECWGGRIVGDDALHRVMSTLRRDLAAVSGGTVGIETIARVGYRLNIETDRASEPDLSGADAAHGRRKARLGLIAALAAAGLVAASVSWGGFAGRTAPSKTAVIAVVADEGTGGSEAARFAAGLTGDLARLASAMTSVAFVEPGNRATPEPLLLRVALERAGTTRRAQVRLIDGDDGAVLWSRDFEADSGTLAELRELASTGIVGVIQCGLDRSAVFDDPVGLRLYLGACEGLETGDVVRAEAFAQQIARYRPKAVAGWACLANSSIFAAAKEGAVSDEVLATAERYARRAIAADPQSGLAYVALGMVGRWRGEPVLDIYEKGIKADPDFALLNKHYAYSLGDVGMVKAAVEPALRAVALHPHDPQLYQLAIATLLNAGRKDEALALSQKMQSRWFYDRGVAMQRLDILSYHDDPAAALATFDASPRHDEPAAGPIRELLHWRVNPAGYDWSRFDQMAGVAYARNPDQAWAVAAVAARMGDVERAARWLDKAPDTTLFGKSALFSPETAALRYDPRFYDKMIRIGAVERWRKSGRWPDFCSDLKLPYDCKARADAALRQLAGRAGENGGRTRART